METKQAVVELADDAIRRQKVVEKPFLAELAKVSLEYRGCKRSELPRLVDRHEDIFELQGLEFKVAHVRFVTKQGGIQRFISIKMNEASVCSSVLLL